MSKYFPWNEKDSSPRAFWDHESSTEKYETRPMSLKERLSNPGLRRVEDVVSDISIGLSQIMDELEKRSQ